MKKLTYIQNKVYQYLKERSEGQMGEDFIPPRYIGQELFPYIFIFSNILYNVIIKKWVIRVCEQLLCLNLIVKNDKGFYKYN